MASFVDGRPRHLRPDVDALGLDAAMVAREMGYATGDVPEEAAAPLNRALAASLPLIVPQTMWLPLPCEVDARADTLRVDGTTFAVGRIVRAHLKSIRAVALFVATIGTSLEQKARAIMKSGDMLEGYMMDAVGSAAAEACTDQAEAAIRAEAEAAGWKITNRLSPGYCEWPTQDQGKLFDLLPGHPCDICLTDSCLMTPIKSVSGVIGLGPDARYLDYMCSVCTLTTCYKRRMPPAEG
jgi:hypothetical protein